jgi:hypothetical protein
MILAVAAACSPTSLSLEPAATITAYIVQVALVTCRMARSDTRPFCRRLTLICSRWCIAGHVLRKRFRETY